MNRRRAVRATLPDGLVDMLADPLDGITVGFLDAAGEDVADVQVGPDLCAHWTNDQGDDVLVAAVVMRLRGAQVASLRCGDLPLVVTPGETLTVSVP